MGEDYKDRNLRTLSSACFTLWSRTEDRWRGGERRKAIIRRFINSSQLFQRLNNSQKLYYKEISFIRNDLNHGGYERPEDADEIRPKLGEYLEKVKVELQNYYNIDLSHI